MGGGMTSSGLGSGICFITHLDRDVVGGEGLLRESDLLERLPGHGQGGILGNGVADGLGHEGDRPEVVGVEMTIMCEPYRGEVPIP